MNSVKKRGALYIRTANLKVSNRLGLDCPVCCPFVGVSIERAQRVVLRVRQPDCTTRWSGEKKWLPHPVEGHKP